MAIFCIVISLTCCIADLVIKAKIENNTMQPQDLKKMPIKIRKAHNPGLIMNTWVNKPDGVYKISIVATMIMVFYQMFLLGKKRGAAEKISGALVLGGALSNFYDRMTRGYVVDYLSIKTKWKKVANIVFNIADICILVGSIGLLLFRKRRKKR